MAPDARPSGALAARCAAATLQGCGSSTPKPAPPPLAGGPTRRLSNGVEMPVVSAGVWQYTPEQAAQSVQIALDSGFRHIDTAYDYKNQQGVAKALKGAMANGISRESIFVTTKVPGCGGEEDVSGATPEECRNDTAARIQDDLRLLELDHIDLLLVHFPPCKGGVSPGGGTNTSACFVNKTGCSLESSCALVRAQWEEVTQAYDKKLLRAVGVSNYCSKCLECIKGYTPQPMVNQVHYQVGMGPDPQGFKSLANRSNMALQSWSPLGMGGKGSKQIMQGNLTTSIAKKHGKSPVQVALKWVVSQGACVSTKSLNASHMRENLDLFDFELDGDDMRELDQARFEEAGEPSFLCRDDAGPSALEAVVV